MGYKKYDYKTCGYLLSTGHIKEFKELSKYLPITPFCRKIGIGYKRAIQIFDNDISSLSLAEMQKAAALLEVDLDAVYQVAAQQLKNESQE